MASRHWCREWPDMNFASEFSEPDFIFGHRKLYGWVYMCMCVCVSKRNRLFLFESSRCVCVQSKRHVSEPDEIGGDRARLECVLVMVSHHRCRICYSISLQVSVLLIRRNTCVCDKVINIVIYYSYNVFYVVSMLVVSKC